MIGCGECAGSYDVGIKDVFINYCTCHVAAVAAATAVISVFIDDAVIT